MSIIDSELDGLCPLVDFDGVAPVCSVDDVGAVVDVTDASVVTVAVGVMCVDVATAVDIAGDELMVLVDISGDAVRYGSVTRMNPGVASPVADVVGVVTIVGSADVAALTVDVTIARFLDDVTAEAGSEASSEMTTASWNPTSNSGIAGVAVTVDVATCC